MNPNKIKWLTEIIINYINSERKNYRRALNYPQALEEAFSGATLHIKLAGSTAPAAVYKDAEHKIPHANPVVFNSAGECPVIFLPDHDLDMTLISSDGTIIATASNYGGTRDAS